MGRHSHRTPFSYVEYENIFNKKINYVNDPKKSDIIIFGYVINIFECSGELVVLLKNKPNLKVVVFSEEPLWDTTNSGDFKIKRNTYFVDGYEIKYTVINHVTSSIYEFKNIPYFITTSDDYFIRYSMMFNRNIKLSCSEIKKVWSDAKTHISFFAEKRELEKKYNVNIECLDIYGLSVYRSKVAEFYNGNSVLRVGKGWGSAKNRQSLVDWHLDKLVTLDYNSFLISALENTHQNYYISEKIFDAYACLGIPIYYSSGKNIISGFFHNNSYINLFGCDANKAIGILKNFEVSDDFVDRYRMTQLNLYDLFKSPLKYINERVFFVDKVLLELDAVFYGEK